jgi:hypothetical protein
MHDTAAGGPGGAAPSDYRGANAAPPGPPAARTSSANGAHGVATMQIPQACGAPPMLCERATVAFFT